MRLSEDFSNNQYKKVQNQRKNQSKFYYIKIANRTNKMKNENP